MQVRPANPNPPVQPLVRSIADAAHMLGCSTVTLRRKIKSGEIPVVTVCGKQMIADSVVSRLARGESVKAS